MAAILIPLVADGSLVVGAYYYLDYWYNSGVTLDRNIEALKGLLADDEQKEELMKQIIEAEDKKYITSDIASSLKKKLQEI